MFSTPLNQDLIKAETTYRQERTRREFRRPTRRRRAERQARLTVRYTKAA